MAEKRLKAVTMKGRALDLLGPELKVGDRAPDFRCVVADLSVLTMGETPHKARLLSVVPSLDTPVCSTQTRRFAQELGALGDSVAAYTISLDLPFAQKRFCAEAGIENITNLSDVHDHSFGLNYGVEVEGLPFPILTRAIFVVDPSNTVTYVEYVPEIGQEPNYEAALAALKAAAGE
jgi:thiol peroxidase